ncbi:murein L,D-transpeptidase family protein [Falsihalocynthiibacter sp. S25ZX9]|uniref:L,D-transpeptidase family protein n=1 Tax=unclassified Falsihalocynthiibacter TaxID=2854191 RepID=UPI0035109B56
MRAVIFALLGVVVLILAGCSSAVQPYTGPEVTRIAVYKDARKMFLLNNGKILKSYNIDLGFAPIGDKEFEGDGKTPEGSYRIDRRNPNSDFYLSIGLSYPNVNDVAEARAQGKSPGGDIFIHGESRNKNFRGTDWTWGCISVSNQEMVEIYRMVKLNTIITVAP